MKLQNYGIRGVPLQLIQSYLSGRKQHVSILGEMSTNLPVVFGAVETRSVFSAHRGIPSCTSPSAVELLQSMYLQIVIKLSH